MKCADIPNEPILRYLADHGGLGCSWWDMERSVVHAMPAGTPRKLRLAKMKQLMKNELVKGCGCGCRGDFELTEKGRSQIS